jgi:hypothetical protein
VEESIDLELNGILSELERIGRMVATKEAELGIARALSISKEGENCYELTINGRSYYLDQALYETLASQIGAIAKEAL